ncbi:MAG: carbohydrate ABC transporter permease [Propionibacteriaceae bacterium]|jgi:arabinosaccharide transport system permease protein|nr:carbohydrate ABC transporter permease [Propionibacteriaceae bacterium]
MTTVTDPGPTLEATSKKKLRSRVGGIVVTVFLLLIALISLIPFIAILIGTFQDGNAVIRNGMSFNIDWLALSFRNYVMLFTDSGLYFSWFANSMILTVVYVACTLLVSSFVAYGLAMYDFKGKTAAFIAVLLILTVPFEMLMLPLYNQVNKMDMDNTFTIVILPFLASAVTIFFFRQYLLGIPKDIIEAGRIDGVSEFGIFFRLIVPIAKPAYAAMAILNGMTCWNNFLWPLLVLRDANKFTLPIGLNTLLTPYGNNYELLIIGSFFSLIPILILFIAFQRFFVEGMTAGAVKG